MASSERENGPAHGDLPLAEAVAALQSVLGKIPQRWLLVDVTRQCLVLVLDGDPQRRWPVSTAAAGINAGEDSGGTPPGVHRIERRIGREAALGTEFVSREPTGRIFSPDKLPGEPDRDLILTRILTLDGCEEGVNRGPGLDSMKRYIYLHGTNREDQLGRPVSHGCIRLGNRDIVAVCDLVCEGDPVVII